MLQRTLEFCNGWSSDSKSESSVNRVRYFENSKCANEVLFRCALKLVNFVRRFHLSVVRGKLVFGVCEMCKVLVFMRVRL